MDCEIIRDLLPLYLDGLTSEKSNQVIEEHLEECEQCKEVLEQMKQEMEVKTEEVKKKINPFRKVNRKIKMYVVATLVVCIAFGGTFWAAFVKGWAVEPEDISMDVVLDGEELLLQFELQNGHVLNAWGMGDRYEMQIGLKQTLQFPGDDRGDYPGQFDYGIQLEGLKEMMKEEELMEYPVIVDYGKNQVVYTMGELQEMAKK